MTEPAELTTASHWVATREEVQAVGAPSGWTRRVATVTEVFFARDGAAPPPDRVRWTSERVRAFCDRVGGKAVFAFRLSLFAVTWVAPLLSLRLPTLGRHSLEERASIIDRFEHSPFGMSIFAVKAFLCMHYFEHPDVAREIGFTEVSDDG